MSLEPVKSRSHLASNDMLVSLGRVFGRGSFTSKEASDRLVFDFLYTSKVLSRISKRPYYHLSVVSRVSRPWGGFENSYAISRRGWDRISYLQNRPAPIEQKPRSSNLMKQLWTTQYLLEGDGKETDTETGKESAVGFKTLFENFPPIPTNIDDVGLLLTGLDPRLLPEAAVWSFAKSPLEQQLRTARRVSYLHRIGLVPKGVDLGGFVYNAYFRGSAESTILFGLVLRRGIELLDELNSLKKSNGTTETLTEPKQTLITMDETKNLQPEKKHSMLPELQNKLLTNELEETSRENIRLNRRIDYLVRHIVNNSKFVELVSKELYEIKDPTPNAVILKSFIHSALTRIAIMNYACVSMI